MRISFDKVYGSIRVYDTTGCLVLFNPEKHDAIYKRIISQKSSVTYVFLIIMQEIKLTHMIICLSKKH